jgi:FtsH-binding integral membrane protein
MEINYIAILIASVLQFIFGALWYTPIFGKVWGRIHGFDKLPKEEQQKMMKKMAPLLGTQFLVTVVTTFVFALLLTAFPATYNVYGLALFFWLGFVVPTQVSAVIFGGTEPRWIVTKLLIMTGASLGCLEIAAATLQFMR